MSEDMKYKIVTYMMRNCQGYQNITPRHKITFALCVNDRYFRSVCKKHIPEVISNSIERKIKVDLFTVITVKPGYYILPLVDPTGIETKIALALDEAENKGRAISEFQVSKNAKQMIASRFQGQKSLQFA